MNGFYTMTSINGLCRIHSTSLFPPPKNIHTPIPLDEVQHFFLLPLALSISAAVAFTPSTTFAGPQHTTDIPCGTGFQVSQLHDHLGSMGQSHSKRSVLLFQRCRLLMRELRCIVYQRGVRGNGHDGCIGILANRSVFALHCAALERKETCCTTVHTCCNPIIHSFISVVPIPLLGPVAASRKSGWSTISSTSGSSPSSVVVVLSCPTTSWISFSSASSASVPWPVKCSRFAGPVSVAALIRPGTGCGAAAPGGDRTGSTVRGGTGRPDGTGTGAGAGAGADTGAWGP